MSAICGLFRLDASPARDAVLISMRESLAHRGSDGADCWTSGPVALGQVIKHSTPGSLNERLPLVHAATGVVLVADARIDNRADLARQLGVARAAQTTDIELVLEAYLRWGSACIPRLIGDFALAIWDPREQTLLCARDPMGVKPFYYHLSPQQFAFATEIKALHCVPGVSRELDPEQVAIFLAWSQPDRESTLFRSVQRLPAAHTLRIFSGRAAECRRYWSLDPHREIRYADPAEYVEQFRDLFLQAVECRLRSVGPIATALSGGLDSSAITCAARRFQEAGRGPQVHALSLVFPSLGFDDLRVIDERRYIDEVVRGGALDWHPIHADRASPLADVERTLAHLDLPFSAPNLYLHWAMYGAAQANGAGVFLDGLDGDTTVSHGLGRLNGLLLAGDWDRFEAEVRGFAGHREISPGAVLPHYGHPFLDDLARRRRPLAWSRAAVQMRSRFGLSARHLIVDHGLAPWTEGRGHAARSARAAELHYLTPALRKFVLEREGDFETSRISREREAHLEGLAQPAYQQTLEIADASAAAFGVEPRYPFFDRRLIEFCLAVPEEQKFADGWPRLLFRRAMTGILPASIQWRASKANLSPGFHRGFRTADRSQVEAADMNQLADFADAGVLRRIRRGYFADESRGWGDPESYLVFRAAVLAAWRSGQAESRPSLVTAAEAA